MEEKCIHRYIVKYSNIAPRKPGEYSAHVINGKVKTIDYEAELLIVESKEGVSYLNIKKIKSRIEKIYKLLFNYFYKNNMEVTVRKRVAD